MFSSTEPLNRSGSWNINAIRRETSNRSFPCNPCTSLPAKVTVPAVGGSRRFRMRRKTLFPAPLGPRTTSTSPPRTAKRSTSSTGRPPYDFVRPVASNMGFASLTMDVRAGNPLCLNLALPLAGLKPRKKHIYDDGDDYQDDTRRERQIRVPLAHLLDGVGSKHLGAPFQVAPHQHYSAYLGHHAAEPGDNGRDQPRPGLAKLHVHRLQVSGPEAPGLQAETGVDILKGGVGESGDDRRGKHHLHNDQCRDRV